MATLNVQYLYDDLPEEYVVSANDWNKAMGTIKSVLNNHAQQIELRIKTPSYFVIGEETGNRWLGSAAPYFCIVTKAMHGKTNLPQVRLFDSENNEIFGSHSINSADGSVIVYSNSKLVIFELEVR